MYQFTKIKLDDGGYRFELGGIKMFISGFSIKDGKHLFTDPRKVIGYFNIDGNIYGVSNDLPTYHTAEDFYDSINSQYRIFTNTTKGNRSENELKRSA